MDKMADVISFYNIFGFNDPNKDSHSDDFNSEQSQDWDNMLNNKNKKGQKLFSLTDQQSKQLQEMFGKIRDYADESKFRANFLIQEWKEKTY